MTLDEAIKHCLEEADNKEQAIYDLIAFGYSNSQEREDCQKCAEEHRQLAEWLRDYQRLLTIERLQLRKGERMTLSDFIEELNIAIRQDGHDIYCNASTAENVKRCLMKQKEGEKKGEWVILEPNGFKCSNCSRYLYIACGDVKMNFCPHCGAVMKGEEK